MAIVSKEQFLKNAQKNTTPRTDIVSREEFLNSYSSEMQRRKTAYENYKKAVEEQRQIWQKNQERRQTQAYAARADARQDVAAAYGQAGAGTAAKRTAYENYTYALKQQELWQKKLRGGTLTPAEEMILNRNVYKSPEKAQQREANQQINDNLQWAQERKQKREAQLSEQEFNRSPAMQAQYGSYNNYLRGVTAGYDEAVAKREQEQAKSADTLRGESQALQQRIDAINAQQNAAWTKNGAGNWDAALKEERDALREQQRSLDNRAYWKGQEEYKAGRQAARDAEQEKYADWTQEQMQGRIDEIDAQQSAAWTKRGSAGWSTELEEEKKAIQRQMNQRYPGALQKAARFAEDAATAFYDAGVAQSMSGFEMARNVAETKVNQGAAWALRDLANAQILKLPGGEKYAEKLRTLADRLSTSYDYTDAQQWNDYYQSIMNEAMQDHSTVGTWIIQQLPSAGAMVNDLMISTASGNALTPLSVMGVRAGGSAMLDAHNEGATDTQALIIGLENAAVEVLSEKLFGGNPVYDEDVGLVNRAVAKLTKSKSVMKVLDSKAFDFVSEGMEEVIAELLEPTFQGLVLNGSLKGTVSWESLGNSFLGGIFLAALGDLAGLPAGLTQAKQERQTKQYAQILAETGAKSESTEVREAAAILQEKLDYGRTPDIEDIGRTLSAMDDAGQTEAAQKAAETAKQSRAYNQYEQAVEDVQRSQAQYDRDTERQRIFRAERDGTITHEQAEAALDSMDQDEAINREEAQRVAARNVQSEVETAEAVGNARARQQSQQTQNETELERQGAARADTTIRRAARQYGWGEQLTGAAAQSYAAYNRGGHGAMSAAEYAAAVNEVRQQGADGIKLDAALRGAQGLPRTIIQTAWEAGRKNTENIKGGNNGTTVSDDGGKRNAGVDSGEQTGSVAEGAGSAEAKQGSRSWREEGRELEDRVRAAKQPGKSAKEIGIQNGSAEKSFYEVPQELWTPSLQKVADYARKNAVKDVHFFVGKIGVVNQRAQVTRYMNGVAIDGNSIWIRVNDNRISPEQIARHEIFHSMAKRAPNMLEAVQEQITKRLGKEKIQALAQRYAEAYEGCYTEAEIEHYLEEICADAYAGIERFSGLSREAMDALRSADGKAQSQKKADSARAPPEKNRYSAEDAAHENRSIKSGREQTQREITEQYQQEVHDILNGTSSKNEALLVGYTPDVYRKLGMPDLPFVVGSGHVYSMAKTASEAAAEGKQRKGTNYHGLGESVVSDIMEFVKDPVMVIAAKDVDANTVPLRSTHSVVALVDVGTGKNSMVIPVAITAERTVNGVRMDVNAISSAYERNVSPLVDEAIAQFNAGENSVFYVKKEAANLLGAGVQFPERLKAAASSNGIVRKLDSKINMSVKNVTESQQFKRWFGDWQNHPETASKVANKDGTPKIVYHGTNADKAFTVFDTYGGRFGLFGVGSYFTENKEVAESYTKKGKGSNPRVYSAFLNIRNPLDMDAKFERNAWVGVLDAEQMEYARDAKTNEDLFRALKEYCQDYDMRQYEAEELIEGVIEGAGYDGITHIGGGRYGSKDGPKHQVYIAFDPEQIKSATDNVGTFDRNNPDIRYSASEEQTEGQEKTADAEAQEKKGYTLGTIPKKAQTYLRKAQNDLLYQLERSIRMPLGRNARNVRGLLDNLTNEYLQTGAVTQETMDKSFEAVYAEGMRLEKEFYEKIRTLAPKLKRMEITPTAEEWAALDNPDAFRKRVKGTLNIVDSGGKSVNEVYEAMSKAAPEVFPRGVTGAAEQELMLMMGARRMQLAEANTKSYDGTNAAIWKRAAKSDFEAGVKDMMGDLNVARRYAESKRKTEKTYQGPQTAEETMELYHELADLKRSYERVAADYLLTAEDRRTVGRLLRGDITAESLRGMENADAILAVYEAKAGYELTALKIEEYKRHIGEARVKQARAALGDVSKYKDKRWGLQYARETQQRNIRDIAPAENAEAINRQYFNPVRKATADATRLKNQMRERVEALNLSRHRKRGNTLSESAAVQILGEAQDNIRVLENSRGRLQDRDGKTLEEWQGIISQLWQENPNLDRAKIENAVKEFHSIYDELYKMMNETRVRNGYAPVNYRAGYFPHFGVGTSDGILNLMGMGMGIDAGIETLPNDAKGIIQWFLKTRKEERGPDALPTEINGRTRSFRPGITWFANALERNGFRTAYDAVLGFDKYIEGASSVIYYTDAIQNLRMLASQVRYLAANDGIREQEDAIRAREDMTEEQKRLAIDNLKKDGKYALSLWVANLDEYTNLLANKKSTLDRDAESLINRSVHSFLKKWQSRVAANMVALNPGSWLTNFGVIAQAGAEMKVSSVLKAMQQQAMNHWTQDGFSERSDFLTSRAGSDTLTAGWVDNASKVLSMPMEWIDTYSANVIVRARYMENLQRGMSEEAAMEEADDFAANVMADRSKGAMPTLFESRNPLFKMFTQFQLEVNNTFSYVFKDLPAEQRKKGIGALALALFKFCLQSWLYNELYESLIGRRPMLDPIDLAMEGAAGYAGYERNNAIRAALSGQKWFEKKDEDEHWLNTTISLAGELGQELPFIGNLLGGGKLPYMSTFPDLGNVVSTITSEEWTAEQKRAKIWKELKDPVMYWVPPFGGGQIKKTTEAITAAKRGGSYAADGTLQYPIYDETAGDKVQKWVTNLVFGKSSTKAAQEWVESGFKNLNRKETVAYEQITQFEDQRETFEFIKAAKKLEKEAEKKSFLASYTGISDRAKAEYYYQVLASDKQKAEMEPLSGQARIAYMNEKLREAQDDQIRSGIRDGVKAGTVSETDAIRRLVAGGFAKDENEAYWMQEEWKGGDSYKKYDEFLSAIESGGDVAKAAKRYLDRGVEAKTLASQITEAYKKQYRAANSEQRKRLKKLLLDAYAALGYDRKDKEKDIDAWLKEDAG